MTIWRVIHLGGVKFLKSYLFGLAPIDNDDMMSRRYKIYEDVDEIPFGISARRYIAQSVRDNLHTHNGHDYGNLSTGYGS